MPRFRSLHSVMFSSMTIFVSSSSDMRTCLRRRTHSRSRRTQVQGSDQSSRITTKVSGTDCAVRSGLRRGAKEREGSESKYAETRARISFVWSRSSLAYDYGKRRKGPAENWQSTGNNSNKYLRDQRPAHLGKYILRRTGWPPVVLALFAGRLTTGWDLKRRQIECRGTLFESPVCHLDCSFRIISIDRQMDSGGNMASGAGAVLEGSFERGCKPRINRFFSGSRFPFATLSSIEDQIFFLVPSLLDGRLLLLPVPNRDPVFWLDANIVYLISTMLSWRSSFQVRSRQVSSGGGVG